MTAATQDTGDCEWCDLSVFFLHWLVDVRPWQLNPIGYNRMHQGARDRGVCFGDRSGPPEGVTDRDVVNGLYPASPPISYEDALRLPPPY